MPELRRIGCHDKRKGEDHACPGREIDTDEGQGVVDEDQHDQHGGGAEDVDIDDRKDADRLRRVEPDDADEHPCRHADDNAGDAEQQRVDKAAQQGGKRGPQDLHVEECVDQRHGRTSVGLKNAPA
jgi:hypothetical protein